MKERGREGERERERVEISVAAFLQAASIKLHYDYYDYNSLHKIICAVENSLIMLANTYIL